MSAPGVSTTEFGSAPEDAATDEAHVFASAPATAASAKLPPVFCDTNVVARSADVTFRRNVTLAEDASAEGAGVMVAEGGAASADALAAVVVDAEGAAGAGGVAVGVDVRAATNVGVGEGDTGGSVGDCEGVTRGELPNDGVVCIDIVGVGEGVAVSIVGEGVTCGELPNDGV